MKKAVTLFSLLLLLSAGALLPATKAGAEPPETLQAAAAKGDTEAEFKLGFLYEQGHGVAKDYPAAAQWYRKAAVHGNVHAARSLALLYESGHGVKKDDAEASKWYRMAAEGGYARAQNDLGQRFEAGQGVPQDTAEAAKWYRKAADQGDAEAQHNLGLLYDGFSAGSFTHDGAEAYFWLSLAAARDEKYLHDRDAMLSALSAEQAAAVQKRLLDWFQKGAAAGDATAEYGLGALYLEGRGVAKNPAQAEPWLLKSANQGNPYAAARLGELYADESFAKKNYEEAYFWGLQAAKGNAAIAGGSTEQYLTQDQVAAVQKRAAAWKPGAAPASVPAVTQVSAPVPAAK